MRTSLFVFAIAVAAATAQVHVRTSLTIRTGHPIRRALPKTVVVRPARANVVVAGSVTYLPVVVWTPRTVALPARARLAFEDSEKILRAQDWVDCHFGVDSRGTALLLDVRGRAQLSFAEVTFGNGQVAVVDFEDRPRPAGLYSLLDFADGRMVKTVRVLARSRTPESRLTVYMSR